jgi:hypothetical protein
VCACWGAGFRPRLRHAAAASAAGGRATRPPATASSKAVDPSEDRKWCRALSTGWQQAVDKRLSRAAMSSAHGHGRTHRAHPLSARLAASSSMEGTSGAADLGPLRGGAGDAALGGTAEGARTGAPPTAHRRSLQPVAPRFHDERCPSGSGWGKTLFRSPARVTSEERPPRREGRPWPVKTRLATFRLDEGRFRQARKRGPARSESARRDCHPWSVQGPSLSREASVTRAGAVCEPRGSEAGERRARAHVRAARNGDQAVVRVCSRVVVVAEVDERRLVQTERSGV